MSQQVLIAGLDPTSYQAITGAELLEMANNSTFATSVGGIIRTQDDGGGNPVVPNPNVDTTLLTWIWVRVGTPSVSGNFAVAYVWNPNSANPVSPSVLLNWNPITAASIPPASIQGFQIAANTIPASALIGGISASQVVGLQSLMLNVLTNISSPAAGAIGGSFGSGFSLTPGAINSSALFTPGVINSYTLLSGQIVLPTNIDTTQSAPAATSVIMAPNGAGQPAAWTLKQILKMGEPQPTQVGYIPSVQSDGSIALVTPTSAFPTGEIFAAAEVDGTGSITISAVSATTNSWTLSTSATSTLIANQTIVTIAGMGTKYTNLNGSWLVTAVTTNTSFTVTTTSDIAGSGTTTIGTCKYANYIGSSCLNVANTPTLVGAGAGAITTYGTTLTVPSVVWNSAGNYTIFFVTARGSATYIVTAQVLDSGTTTELLATKIKAKNTAYVTIETSSIGTSEGVSLTPTNNSDLSVIAI